jgi:predicted dehydrogenase/threonine dehydrogenase-like Zn-dependent dehydrogenase
MKQIIQSFKTGDLWLADVPIPACKSGGVLVQTRNSFVSAGTERMLVDFAKKNLAGKALAMPDQVKKVLRKMQTEGIFSTLEKVQAKLDQPIPLGYSCAGVVAEAGAGVTGLCAGDRVACGGAGYANHAQYNYVPKNLVVRIPDTVSMEDASCATVGSIALQGVRQCDLGLGENVCIMGLGLLGLLAVQMMKAAGVRVMGFDPDTSRCRLALDLGADRAVSSDLVAACNEFSRGYGVDAVLITAAAKSNEPVTLAGEISRMKGRVVVTGLVGMDLPRDMYYKKELDFKLSLSYGPGRYDPAYEEGGQDYPYGYVRWTEQRNIQAFLDLVASGAVTPSKLVTHRFDIDDALNAYELILGKTAEPYLGIVLTYGEQPVEIKAGARQIRVKDAAASGTARIEAGFIGAGNFTKAVLLPALKKQPDVHLNTLCTATGMNAGQTAEKEGFACATTDFQVVLDNEQINTVFVTTRHNSHARFVTAALAAGKHVFVEKPLCLTPEDLQTIHQTFHKSPPTPDSSTLTPHSPPILMVGFNRRFSPHAAFIRDYFQGRQTPMMVNYRINAGIIPPDVWVQDPEVGGGRIVGEVCHFIDFASFVIGTDPVEVQAMCVDSTNAALKAEDNVTIAVKYGDGSVAQICYVAVGPSDLAKEYCEVFADESAAVMDNFCTTRCMGRRGKKRLKGSQKKGFSEEIAAFLEAVQTGAPPPIPFESLALTTACTFAAKESLRTRTAVRL